MTETILYVGLKVPDNIAKTAFNALNRMGHELDKLERFDYYRFVHAGSQQQFQKKIIGTDTLVNANKHAPLFELDKESEYQVLALITDNKQHLRDTLASQGILVSKAIQGTLWRVTFLDGANIQERAQAITKDLLMNPHFQTSKIW